MNFLTLKSLKNTLLLFGILGGKNRFYLQIQKWKNLRINTFLKKLLDGDFPSDLGVKTSPSMQGVQA